MGLLTILILSSGSSAATADPTAPSQEAYRPSDIEIHISRAAAAAYLNDYESLEDEYIFFKGMDGFLRTKEQPCTGLSDNILDLAISNIRNQDDFINAQRGLLSETPDKKLREKVKFRIKDEAEQADSLLVTDIYNRFTFIFNTFVRPLSLLALGYFPAVIDAGVATLLNVDRLTDLSVEEKKALVLYNQFMEKYPDSDKAEVLRRRITMLDRKRISKYYKREMTRAQTDVRNGNFWQAQQCYKNALAYRPDSSKASEGLERARELEFRRNRLKKKSLEPAAKDRVYSDTAENRDYQDILYAAASSSPEMMIYEAEDFLSKYPESALSPYALYTIASALDMKGAHEKAKDIMREIAQKDRGLHIGNRSAAYLNDKEYNLYRAFQDSCRKRGVQTTQYVFLGQEFAKSNIILGTSRIITQGLSALQSLGTFNIVAIAIRGASTLLGSPVSYEEVIDAGLRYLRRYPDSAAAPEVHLVIGRAYAKRKNLSKAVYHYTASGRVSEEKLDTLREKAAKQYLDFAAATESKEEKIHCYEMILEEFPRTRSAVKALEQLALLERRRKPLFQIDKKSIGESPILFELTELNLSPHLLDGNPENGEVASRGLYSTERGTITIVYQDSGGEREETVQIDYPLFKRLVAFADEIHYRKELAQKEKKNLAGRFPLALRGTVGGDGVYVYPRLKVKPYRGEDLYLYK
jgi:TolA-binding protein